MEYTVTQSKDPEMYEFWSEYSVNKVKKPMLCMIIHSDCLDYGIIDVVKHCGEAKVSFNIYA